MANTQTLNVGPVGAGILSSLADNWWLLLLRGIAAIVFGVLAFIWPGITLLTLTLFWGAYALVDGALALWAAITGGANAVAPRWWLAIVGVAGILSGLVAFFWPGVTAFVLLMFIASWSIVIGVMQIVGAIQLRKEIDGEWLLILSGLLSIAFGVILMMQPGAGALAVVWIIGWYAILIGILTSALAFRLKRYKTA
jgi:uncharacterized membrane protein HdeD (DUF308 family)